MANYVSLNLFGGDKASVATATALPTSGNGTIIIEQIQGTMIIGSTTILSRIILSSFGLNRSNKVYYSASDVATIVTALGATFFKTVSVYRSVNSTAAVNVAFPVAGGIGIIIETAPTSPNVITIAGVPILSVFTLSHGGLNQGFRTYYSGATVAANVTIMG